LVRGIYPDLTSGELNLTVAGRLFENNNVCFHGVKKIGSFDIDGASARGWLLAPVNANGKANSQVLMPVWNGADVMRRPNDRWIIDFGMGVSERDSSLFEAPFEYVKSVVWPERKGNRNSNLVREWWLLGGPRPALRRPMSQLERVIATPALSKHRVFVWIPKRVLPDAQLMVTTRDDDTTFGILHSRFHEAWSLRLGTSLEDRPRYTPTTTFETFPFPEGLTPNIPAKDYADDPRAIAIAKAAKRLDELRNAWLNPPDLIDIVPEVVPGYPDRILPKNDEAAAILKKRTLTNLYNQRPQWLADAHRDLDAAVAAAYGWPADISEEEALAKLLALNLARAGAAPANGDDEQ
jgi:hypothetical protein